MTYKGTVKWKIQDDQGQSHLFTLPNSYYVATAPSRILCPQHLAQTAKDNYPLPLGTGEVTGDEYDDQLVMPRMSFVLRTQTNYTILYAQVTTNAQKPVD